MFWDRSSGPFPAFFISIYNLFNKSPNMAPKQPSRHGYRFWVSINSINSVPSFGTDQTAVQGLKLTETSKSTKNGNKTQVGRESYLSKFEELPNPESTRSLSRVERFSFSPRRPPTVGSPGILERSQRLSLSKNHHFHFCKATASLSLVIHVFALVHLRRRSTIC